MDAANSTETTKRVIGRPFPPGVSGNPSGRPKGLSLTKLIIEELSKNDEQAARLLVRAMLRKAKKGDVAAFTQLIERTDGKVTQRIDIESRVRQLAEEAGIDPDEAVEEARRASRGAE